MSIHRNRNTLIIFLYCLLITTYEKFIIFLDAPIYKNFKDILKKHPGKGTRVYYDILSNNFILVSFFFLYVLFSLSLSQMYTETKTDITQRFKQRHK